MSPDREKESSEQQTLWTAAGQFTGHGLTWALSVLVFLLGGWWLDERIGTTPLLMILGAFVGAGAGFYSLYRHVAGGAGARSEPPEGEDRGPVP